MKNSKNIIIGALLIVILTMAVGYSAFTTELTVNGTAEITGQWNVKITNIQAEDVSDGCDAGDMQFTNTTVTFNAKLNKPGDYITYIITIENAGTIDAKLNSITFTPEEEGSPAISYTTRDPIEILRAGELAVLLIKVSYDESTQEIPEIKTKSITGIIEYVQD